MELDAFTSRLGLGQGRIAPVNSVPVSGDYVFVLGDDEPGRIFELDSGDHAEVVQDTDLSGVDLVRAHFRLRVPSSLPTTLVWEVSITVDGVKQARFACTAGRDRVATDMAANVSKLSGVHQVGIRLELVEV